MFDIAWMANKKEYKLKSKMRYSELEEWRKKRGWLERKSPTNVAYLPRL